MHGRKRMRAVAAAMVFAVVSGAVVLVTSSQAAAAGALIAINNVSVTEGDTGTLNAAFTVSKSTSIGGVSVSYSTSSGGATAPADYTAVSGTLSIPSGRTSATLSVPIVGDLLDENNEGFRVILSAPVGGTILDGVGDGTIVDNDALPALRINNRTVTEGDSGTTNATFTVTLSPVSGRTVSVNYATASSTATSGSDYLTKTGTLSFAAGITTRTITVAVVRNGTREPLTERFFVNLSGVVNATFADSQGQGTITDDDPVWSLFNGAATGHNWTNAYLLGEVSHFMYKEEFGSTVDTEPEWEAAFENKYGPAGVSNFLYNHGGMTIKDFYYGLNTSTEAVLMYNDSSIVIGFRGTKEGLDFWTDLQVVPQCLDTFCGTWVHSGFWNGLNEVYATLKADIQSLTTGRRIWITGHSLGGALATVLGYRLERDGIPVQGVSTYGSPRVGNSTFAATFEGMLGTGSQRWVNNADPVALAPPFPMEHVNPETNNILSDILGNRIELNSGERLGVFALVNFPDHSTKRYTCRIFYWGGLSPTTQGLLPQPPSGTDCHTLF